jgi:uncharacterized protein (TIGR00251 family)
VILAVRLTPRAGRDAIDGWALDGEGRPYLKVRVAAPPVEGEANQALIALLAKTLRRPKSAVTVVSGPAARLKRIEISGVTQEDVDAAFGAPPPSSLA